MSGGARLAEKAVVVVGAGSVGAGWSNGRACAVAYARAGSSVVCVDRLQERAQDTVDIIVDEGGEAFATSGDATHEEDMLGVVRDTVARYGGVDVLHNNVGVGGTFGTPDQVDPLAWDRELAQNLTSAYIGIRCAVPAMRARGGGVIINTSSALAVRFLSRPTVAYSAAKAGVEGLTRACAVAYGRDNIRVNCVRIGFSETPLMLASVAGRGMTEAQAEAAMARSRAKVPLRGEHGDPFDVAAAAVYLASDEARYVTGVILDVDGGLACAPI